jgi:hypothetical protein
VALVAAVLVDTAATAVTQLSVAPAKVVRLAQAAAAAVVVQVTPPTCSPVTVVLVGE